MSHCRYSISAKAQPLCCSSCGHVWCMQEQTVGCFGVELELYTALQ